MKLTNLVVVSQLDTQELVWYHLLIRAEAPPSGANRCQRLPVGGMLSEKPLALAMRAIATGSD
ncbi:MAG TPA: hypothetical protein VHV10_19140 [Ktedonobacteraceae bacterium]|nr:hypothetical protein [Ktedonobacteraceae bacterium]